MSVRIGIVTKNRESLLPKAIDSAFNQDYTAVSVTVFDDHSSDNTFQLKERYPYVDWEFSEETKGYLFARNKFMQQAKTEYFCSLDDDSWFVNGDELALAVSFLETHRDVAAIAFDIISPDKPTQRPRSEPVEAGMYIGCGHVLRLSSVKEVGYYDPNPSFYGGEEKEMCLKLIDRGYKIVFLPGVHVWHEKTTLARDEKAQHSSGVCNDLALYYRRAPFVFLWPGLFLKIFSHLKFSLRYKNGLLFRAGLQGVSRFIKALVGFQFKRSPVSMKAMREFISLNRKVHVQ